MKRKSPQLPEPIRTSSPSKAFAQVDVVERLQRISFANLPATLVSKEVIAAVISVNNCSTLKYYRNRYWLEGAHFFFLGPKKIAYNLELISDWAIHNRLNPQIHQRAIEAFLVKVESDRSTKKRRRRIK